jgi:hypothetical protein
VSHENYPRDSRVACAVQSNSWQGFPGAFQGSGNQAGDPLEFSELARAHGATPLLVVLQFGHEAQPEQMLRRRILDDASIPYVFVEIDSSWRLPWDRHLGREAERDLPC